jgi:hypothetical protein
MKVKPMAHPQDNGAGQWEKLVEKVLSQWQQPQIRHAAFEQTFLFREALRNQPGEPSAVLRQIFTEALAELEAKHAQERTFIKLRYEQGKTPVAVAREMDVGESTQYRLRKSAFEHLAQALAKADAQAAVAYRRRIEQRLEPNTATAIFGRSVQLQALLSVLTTPKPPWLICIEGLGGIGKTTLADSLVRHCLDRSDFVDFAWISARPQRSHRSLALSSLTQPVLSEERLLETLADQLLERTSPAPPLLPERLFALLQTHLRQQPHLIVIDNLETADDLDTLLPLVRRLAGPTKFLFTSRNSLYDQGDVYSYRVPELEVADAFALIRHEAQLRNVVELIEADEAALQAIFDTVGGNPLALRLVVGQSYLHALETVLSDLRHARGHTADQLYTYIYWRAWKNLSPTARDLLLAMPTTTERGASIDYLSTLTGLNAGDLSSGLTELMARNLVDSRNQGQERRYTIHSLTRSFLNEQVGKWRL